MFILLTYKKPKEHSKNSPGRGIQFGTWYIDTGYYCAVYYIHVKTLKRDVCAVIPYPGVYIWDDGAR